MGDLSLKNCEPCPADGVPLTAAQQQELMVQLSSGWTIESGPNRLVLNIKTENLSEALEKAQVIGKMADEQWHHPKLTLEFKNLQVEIYTHVINDLREADFIFASKVDRLFNLS